MKKSIFTLIAALCCTTLSATIINGTSGDLTFSLNTDNGQLSFDGNGAMADYEANNQPWKDYRSTITNIYFWGNPTTIGKYAFASCNNLTSCNFPSSLTKIGDFAFNNCTELAVSVSLSSGIISIGTKAFDNCTKITDFYFGATLASIGVNAFDGCYGVTFYIVSEDNTNFSSPNFVLCDKAQTKIIAYPTAREQTTYTMPQTITTLEQHVFAYATKLTAITLSPKLQTISEAAFASCTALTEITIPQSVTEIRSFAFTGCTALAKITSEPQTPPTASINSFQEVNKSIPVYIPAGSLDAYKAATGWSSFTKWISAMKCGDNVSAIISEDAKTLTVSGSGDMWNYTVGGEYTPWRKLEYDNTITTIIIEDGVTSVGDLAFTNCKNTTSVTLPNGLTTIGDRAFENDDKLASVTIPASVTSIGWRAFFDTGLSTVAIPAKVSSIGENAFNAPSLTAYNVDNTNTAFRAIDGVLFTKNKKNLIHYPAKKQDKAYTVPDGVESINDFAYISANVINITLPASLLAVGKYVFPQKIVQITSYATVPPALGDWSFPNDPDWSIPVFVPKGSKALYGAANVWSKFTNVQETLEPQSIPQLNHQSQITNHKSIINGHLLIHHNGQTFDARGARVE